MNQNSPMVLLQKKPTSLFKKLHLSGEMRKYYLILVILAALLASFIFIQFSQTGNLLNTLAGYSPSDVVYGKRLVASRGIPTDNHPVMRGIYGAVSDLRPHIQISEQFHDFGMVFSSQVLTRNFAISNIGQSTLTISNAYTTCGCTTADFTTVEIPPGKVALMTLQFDPGYHDMRGTTVRRGVVIESNDPDHPIEEIWFQASVR